MKIIDKFNEGYKKAGAVNMVFFGDSVTHGCFESGSDMHASTDFKAVYHNVLKEKLSVLYPKMPINIINSGIGGESAKSALKRLDRDVISKNPDFAVVCFGLNDVNGSLDDYIDSLDLIFKTLNKNGIESVFMTPNMLNTYVVESMPENGLKDYAKKTADFQMSGKFDNYIKSAADCASENKITVADCYSKWKTLYKKGVDTTLLLANFINHPKREMHNLFAHELINVIFNK